MKKLSQFINHHQDQVQAPAMVQVSDYAVCLGAEFATQIPKGYNSKLHWAPRPEDVPTKETKPEDWGYGSMKIWEFGLYTAQPEPQVVGIAPVIDPVRHPGFGVQNGFLTYKNQLVSFPQQKVRPEMKETLTDIFLKDREVRKIENPNFRYQYGMNQYGHDKKNKTFPACYQYNQQWYVLHEQDWYRVGTVEAHLDDQGKVCTNHILIADCGYDEDKFVKDLISGTVIGRTFQVSDDQTIRKNVVEKWGANFDYGKTC